MTLPMEALLSLRDGEIVEQGWVILYQFGSSDGVTYMEVYDMHRMTSDDHWRIYATGATESLPAFRSSVTYPFRTTEEEKQRIAKASAEHNESVQQLFQQKWHKQFREALELAQQHIAAEGNASRRADQP